MPVKNDEMQGVRILRNEAYMQYAARTKDEVQRRKSHFSTACYGRPEAFAEAGRRSVSGLGLSGIYDGWQGLLV